MTMLEALSPDLSIEVNVLTIGVDVQFKGTRHATT